MKVIGFGAHPDDVEIFFLGLLLACRARGDEIGWAVATDGARGGTGDRDTLAATRRQEAGAAAALCDVTPWFLERPDGCLTSDPALPSLVEDVLAREAPDLIVTHGSNDYHPDHRALSRAVADAARFRIPVLFADSLAGVDFQPTHYVDVTPHMETKRAAIRAHHSQRPERFVEMAEILNRLRALQCNAEAGRYAEGFRFEPRYPFSDIRDLLPPAPPVRPLGL